MATESDSSVTFYDLQNDSDTDHPLTEPPCHVVKPILERASKVVGDFPSEFRAYQQRRVVRSMRTFTSL